MKNREVKTMNSKQWIWSEGERDRIMQAKERVEKRIILMNEKRVWRKIMRAIEEYKERANEGVKEEKTN